MKATLGNEKVEIQENDRLSFTYNDKLRVGRVETVKAELVTLEVQGQFKSFRFDRMQSEITMLSTADGKSGFVASLGSIDTK